MCRSGNHIFSHEDLNPAQFSDNLKNKLLKSKHWSSINERFSPAGITLNFIMPFGQAGIITTRSVRN